MRNLEQELDDLGVSYQYDQNKKPNSVYTLKTVPNFDNPFDYKNYFNDVVETVAQHAKEKGELERIAFNYSKQYEEDLLEATEDQLDEINRQSMMRNDLRKAPLLSKIMVRGSGIAAGAAAIAYTYGPMAYAATSLAQKMNADSPLIAPLTGALQAVISLTSLAFGYGVNKVIGFAVFIGPSAWYTNYKTSKVELSSAVARVHEAIRRTGTEYYWQGKKGTGTGS